MSESVWLDCDALEELPLPDWVFTPTERRRVKASLVLLLAWGSVSLLHWFPETRWIVTVLMLLMAIHAVRIVTASLPAPALAELPLDLDPTQGEYILPKVSVLIPAKNESAVLPGLVNSLAALHYPAELIDLWIIDDGSTDSTPQVLADLQTRIPQLHVHQRPPGSGGGKSGALNEVLPLTQGDIILVCDADAYVPPDLLRRSLPLFMPDGGRPIGAVQVRKAIINADHNWLTHCQRLEMACDSYLQQHRLAIDGIGELRGNGQLVRRDVLAKCGGWNEATLTDDLDLTFKLHLAQVDIAFLPDPAINEEGVTRWQNLWHQRSRWAEGGYQRYLDYWPGILGNGMGLSKGFDLAMFFLCQYLMPMTLIPDLLWTVFYTHYSVLWSINLVMGSLLAISFAGGLHRVHGWRGWRLFIGMVQGLLYILHWIPVMIFTTTRMCVQPKRLRWVKTVHQGSGLIPD